MKESDLYPAVKALLEGQGFEVKAEVGACDVVGVRADEEPVVVELKRTLTLKLLLQAVDRLSLTSRVYLAVPGTTPMLRRERARVVRLLRMLGLGLLRVDGARAEVVLDPGPYRGPRVSTHRRGRLLGEFERRVGDPNRGGQSARQRRVTAYRQRAVAIAVHLEAAGPTKASAVAAAVGDPKAREVLYRDVHGWFDRLGQGVYALSPRGRRELPGWRADTANGG